MVGSFPYLCEREIAMEWLTPEGGQNCLFWTGDKGTLLYHNTKSSAMGLLRSHTQPLFGLSVAFQIQSPLGCDIQP